MKAELAFLNGFELHINIREKRERLPDVENVMPADVEICRTVFADNLPVMDYNDHKHKNIVGNLLNRRVCYVRRIGSGYQCHYISDGSGRCIGDFC